MPFPQELHKSDLELVDDHFVAHFKEDFSNVRWSSDCSEALNLFDAICSKRSPNPSKKNTALGLPEYKKPGFLSRDGFLREKE
jgi:hypothetical protein